MKRDREGWRVPGRFGHDKGGLERARELSGGLESDREKWRRPGKGWRGPERVGKGQGGMKRASDGWVGDARKS